MTQIKKDFSGQYNSTNKFVFLNELEKEATELFGEDWEAEDDVAQIENLIEHVSGQGKFYKVYCDEHREEDDIIVELSEDKIRIDELEEIINSKKKCTHYLFGTDACQELLNDSFAACRKHCEETGDFAIYKFTEGETSSIELINAYDGWGEFCIIKEEEYNILATEI